MKSWNEFEFCSQIRNDGFYLMHNVLDKKDVAQLRYETEAAINKEAAYHGTTAYRDYGVVQACPMYGGAFLSVLENRELMEPFNKVMGTGSILYVYISSSMPPGCPNFSSRVHVDRPRLFPNYCECLAGLVLLDDFNEKNGSTFYLPGSHNLSGRPSDKEFYRNAKMLIAPAGSVFYFNLRLWHAGGINGTDKWRHALALGVVRPYLKQKFDFPSMLRKYNVDIESVTDYARQKLGFFAVPPATLDEFYGPAELRTYKERSEWEVAAEETNVL
jgi:hypothetical protein